MLGRCYFFTTFNGTNIHGGSKKFIQHNSAFDVSNWPNLTREMPLVGFTAGSIGPLEMITGLQSSAALKPFIMFENAQITLQYWSTLEEFRPIACCSTVYKFLAKILTSRLKRVVDYIVGNSRSAFIEGRIILDNVIIDHELVKGYINV